jgi:hypothetical protein
MIVYRLTKFTGSSHGRADWLGFLGRIRFPSRRPGYL